MNPLTDRKRGRAFLTQPPYENALYAPTAKGSDDLLAPNDAMARFTFDFPSCQVPPCRDNVTATARALQAVGLQSLRGLTFQVTTNALLRCGDV
jgi:hypothetical protein